MIFPPMLAALPWTKLIYGGLFGLFCLAIFMMGWRMSANHSQAKVDEMKTQIAIDRALVAERIAKLAESQIEIQASIGSFYHAQNAGIAATRADIAALSRGVRICEQTSTLALSVSTERAAAEATSGQPRPAETVLQELAARFAESADRNAVQLNSLIDWVEQTRAASLQHPE